MLSRFFIDRPILAAVMAMLITLAGAISIFLLPIAQYPEITPPTVEISAVYPGANAETVAEALAAPIEQELSGAQNLIYFQSYAGNDGSLRVIATFETGSNLDDAAVEVQNRIDNATPRLPQETIRQGITVSKASNSLLMVGAIKSTNPAHDALFLNGFANVNILDNIKRLPGVGTAQVFGGRDYSMRIWLNPDLMKMRGLTVQDVSAAVQEQNGLYAAGRIGASPSGPETELTIPVTTRGRLQTPEEFADIVIRAEPDGSSIRIRDIGRVELGAQSYDLIGRQDGVPTTFLLTYLKSGGNALDTAASIRSEITELSETFPEGIYVEFPYDVTPFVRIAIIEVVKTFAEAIVLVTLVILLFLGTWRATLIPLAAIPVAIVGTFAGMLLLGFSINSLTLFGLVLAIGIVVDDAIIVVENVERLMEEEHLPPREATIKAMRQVTGPVIAMVLVLNAVFLPVAFLGGLTGEMYRQFAITIALSVAISGFVALTLSPALCALMLKPSHKKFLPFRLFDRFFDGFTSIYARIIRQTIRYGFVTFLVFGALLWWTHELFQKVPSGFIPQEDQGYFIVAVVMPPGTAVERTGHVISEVEAFLKSQPEVRNVVSLGGIDFLSGGVASTSAGIMFVPLKDWSERRTPDKHVDALVGRTFMAFGGHKEALVLAFNPPPVMGLGLRAGFELQLQDRTGGQLADLANTNMAFLGALQAEQGVLDAQSLNGFFFVNTPKLRVDIDHLRAKARGVRIEDVYNTLQTHLGGLYVNDFTQQGRIYRVQLQAEQQFRSDPGTMGRFTVRNERGQLVPLSDLLTLTWQAGPNVVSRFNGYPSVQITGTPATNVSTGAAIQRIQEVAEQTLPKGYTYEWSGASFQEIRAGNQAPFVIALGLFVVFLVLAGQYEQWSLPFAVLLGIPSAAFGAIVAIALRGLSQDIYFQIGLLTLIGLAAKNAILIVEFASKLRATGMSLVEAGTEAARVRLRPFMMTSLAFILGVLPLVLSEGAGAAGRHSIGTCVMGGMMAATFLDMFFVPLFFAITQWTGEKLGGKGKHKGHHDDLHHHAAKAPESEGTTPA